MNNSYVEWPSFDNKKIYVMKFADNKPVLPHTHNFIELVIMGRGTCKHKYNGTEIPIVPGDSFVVLPNEVHSYDISNETTIYNCLFYPEALGEDWRSIKKVKGIYNFLMVEPSYRLETGKQEIIHLNSKEFEYVERLLNYMIEEQDGNTEVTDLVLKANLILVLIFLGKVWDNQFKDQLKLFDEKRDMLNKALSYIENNLNEEFNVNKLAAMTYLSPGYFRKIFKESVGLTPLEYINRLRISQAISLIKEGGRTVSEISELVGISDPNYFARLFKKITGTTPSDYEKK